MQNFFKLLAQLESEIKSSRKTYTSQKKERLISIVHNLQSSVPEVINQAEYIVRFCEDEKKKAIQEANQIITKARINADKLIENSQVIKEAKNTANMIIDKALSEKDTALYKVRDDVDNMLQDVESKMAQALSIIARERDNLKKK